MAGLKHFKSFIAHLRQTMAQVGFVFVGALVLALKYGACKFQCIILHGGGVDRSATRHFFGCKIEKFHLVIFESEFYFCNQKIKGMFCRRLQSQHN